MKNAAPVAVHATTLDAPGVLPDGALGIDAGLTLTKVIRASGSTLSMSAYETHTLGAIDAASGPVGVTGAHGASAAVTGATPAQEIDAATRGVIALMAASGRAIDGDFVLTLLGTGTAFAAVRDGTAQHLGGTPMGGGSFTGIACRIDPALTYAAMIAGAARGNRRNADLMVSDAYPDGIGRIGPDLTAAHLAKDGDASIDDVLAALLNMHGENIGQIAAGRAVVANVSRIVLAGGFAHDNDALVTSISGMTRMFGLQTECAPWPGFAGAVGAALIAADTARDQR